MQISPAHCRIISQWLPPTIQQPSHDTMATQTRLIYACSPSFVQTFSPSGSCGTRQSTGTICQVNNKLKKSYLWIEMEHLHQQHGQVLACDTDIFMGDTPANLNHFLDTSTTAACIQNWLHVWKLLILSCVKLAKELSLHGIQTMTSYFTPTSATSLQTINNRSHHTARPRLQAPHSLPQPSFWFWSLWSFFALHSTTILTNQRDINP
jgi:hypothetical protein